MDTITLSDGRLQHTTGDWIGIQNPNEPITKTKWTKKGTKTWEIKSASNSKPGVVYTYTVIKNAIGMMSCSWLGYTYHKNCKHLSEVSDEV